MRKTCENALTLYSYMQSVHLVVCAVTHCRQGLRRLHVQRLATLRALMREMDSFGRNTAQEVSLAMYLSCRLRSPGTGDFRQWVESVASLPIDPPTLPPTFGIVGPEMGWAHNAVYTRVVRDAKRAVSANELATRTASNLASTHSLVEELRGLRQRLGRVLEPEEDSDSDIEPLPALPRVPVLPSLPRRAPLPPAMSAGSSAQPLRETKRGGSSVKRSSDAIAGASGSGPTKKARRKTEG